MDDGLEINKEKEEAYHPFLFTQKLHDGNLVLGDSIMYKLLQMRTYGVKNLEKEIKINFSNLTVEKGVKKVNKVKAIYGYNGSGKTAIIESAYLYKKIALDKDYLSSGPAKKKLSSILNKKRDEFYIAMTFFDGEGVYKHELKVKRKKSPEGFYIDEETLSVPKGRTLDEDFSTILSIKKGSLSGYEGNDLSESSIVSLYEDERFPDLKSILSAFYGFVLDLIFIPSGEEEGKGLSPILSSEHALLEDFIRLFKPSLKEIKTEGKLDSRKIYFLYDGYEVDFDSESEGIKKMVGFFPYLRGCANGKILFVDELDWAISSLYLEKLVSFFLNFGEGQFIFTIHNLSPMNAMKKEARSIEALDEEGSIKAWVAKGNRSPVSDYYFRYFSPPPTNIEDFDFLSPMQGEGMEK